MAGQQPPQHGETTTQPIELTRANISTPTLQWVSVEDPGISVALGEDDYVLDSYFDPQFGAWEVLVLLEPAEEDEDEAE